MKKLHVTNFSCITDADLDLGSLTILIGPQASGKSVLSKLTYFFISVLKEQARHVIKTNTLESYKQFIKQRFHEWFPSSAWGDKKFSISYKIGSSEIKISRTGYRETVSDNIRVTLSKDIQNQYNSLLKQTTSLTKKTSEKKRTEFDFDWRIYELCEKSIQKLLGRDYVVQQLYVPAGRSFFTSIGKAFSIFELGGGLDPMAMRFGRFYASIRERSFYNFGRATPQQQKITQAISEIFGGEIKVDGDKEYVLTKDAREIPFSALSSGQQELLPLMILIPFLTRGTRGEKQLVYIEEPEAHLFPTAQSKLVEAFASLINTSNQSLDMLITTHSPYVLSKINNLIKAGQLEKTLPSEAVPTLDKIISKTAWIPGKSVKAYAIQDGHLHSIIDSESGLIAADYLDDVSGDISNEFLNMLGLEAEHGA